MYVAAMTLLTPNGVRTAQKRADEMREAALLRRVEDEIVKWGESDSEHITIDVTKERSAHVTSAIAALRCAGWDKARTYGGGGTSGVARYTNIVLELEDEQ